MNDEIRLTFAVMAFAVVAMLCYPLVSYGQVEAPRDLDRVERQLALDLARVAFNEALDSPADLEMIAQVVFGAAHTPRARLAFLRRHSPCATGQLSETESRRRGGNCRWSRALDPSGRRPAGWERERDGRWSWVRERWLDHLRRAIAYVRAPHEADLCATAPHSWDGKAWRERIVERGWTILPCSEHTRNYAVIRARYTR